MTIFLQLLLVGTAGFVLGVLLGERNTRRVPEITWDERHSDDCPALVRFYPSEEVECLCGVDAAIRETVDIIRRSQ